MVAAIGWRPVDGRSGDRMGWQDHEGREAAMPLNALCPECGGTSTYAGSDERGTVYTCESADGTCVVFDHWGDDVRTYRSTSRRRYEDLDDD